MYWKSSKYRSMILNKQWPRFEDKFNEKKFELSSSRYPIPKPWIWQKKEALFFTSIAAVFPISVKKITILKFHVLTIAHYKEHVLVLISIAKSAELVHYGYYVSDLTIDPKQIPIEFSCCVPVMMGWCRRLQLMNDVPAVTDMYQRQIEIKASQNNEQ